MDTSDNLIACVCQGGPADGMPVRLSVTSETFKTPSLPHQVSFRREIDMTPGSRLAISWDTYTRTARTDPAGRVVFEYVGPGGPLDD